MVDDENTSTNINNDDTDDDQTPTDNNDSTKDDQPPPDNDENTDTVNYEKSLQQQVKLSLQSWTMIWEHVGKILGANGYKIQ